MSLKPTGKMVLVAEMAQKQHSSGLIIKGMSDTKTARILAIGPEVKSVDVGEQVILNWSKGVVVNDEGSQRVLISENEILVVIEDEDI